jgi:hypothetical protein
MARKEKDPFARQYHRGPDLSVPPDIRWQQARTVGRYYMFIGDQGRVDYYLYAPIDIPTLRAAVIEQRGERYDIAWTWIDGPAFKAMERLPASEGWVVVETTEKRQAQWRRPAPVTRSFLPLPKARRQRGVW